MNDPSTTKRTSRGQARGQAPAPGLVPGSSSLRTAAIIALALFIGFIWMMGKSMCRVVEKMVMPSAEQQAAFNQLSLELAPIIGPTASFEVDLDEKRLTIKIINSGLKDLSDAERGARVDQVSNLIASHIHVPATLETVQIELVDRRVVGTSGLNLSNDVVTHTFQADVRGSLVPAH